MRTIILDNSPAAASATDVVELHQLVRVFGRGEGAVRALDGVSLSLARGTFTAIMGPSGSGKSTLLQIAAGLDRPTSGACGLGGHDLGELGREGARPPAPRADRVRLPVVQPARRADRRAERRAARRGSPASGCRAPSCATRSSASGSATAPATGPRSSRAASSSAWRSPARSSASPTSSSPTSPPARSTPASGRAVLALLRDTIDEGGRTLVMVTHDPSAAAWADRVVFMADGRLAGELVAPTAEQVAERLTGLGA